MLAYKKIESSNNTSVILNDVPSGSLCNCCREEIDSLDNCNLSCGHVYHYDCIYYAFCANKKRGSVVLECPYCRKKVNPLPEKEGFSFDNYIHGGNYKKVKVDKSKFSTTHLGKGFCAFKKGNGLYCNSDHAMYGLDFSYCYSHRNVAHLGENYCKYKASDKGNYCNLFLLGNSNPKFCKNHLNSIECVEILKSGKKKGTACGIINCKRHVKKNDDVDKKDAVNSIKIVELNEEPLLVQNPITVYKSVNQPSLPPNQLILNASQVAHIQKLLTIVKNQVDKKEQIIIEVLLDNYFS
jgi:hypothetical protein